MIITLLEFKKFLGIPAADTANDDKLTKLLTAAYKNAEGFNDRVYDNADYTEYQSFGQDAVKRIYTKNIPIVTLTSLTINDSVRTVDEDYYLDEKAKGLIILESEHDLTNARSVKIEYNAGWTALTFPKDLEEAIFKLAVRTDKLTQGTIIQTGDTILTFSKKEIYDVLERY